AAEPRPRHLRFRRARPRDFRRHDRHAAAARESWRCWACRAPRGPRHRLRSHASPPTWTTLERPRALSPPALHLSRTAHHCTQFSWLPSYLGHDTWYSAFTRAASMKSKLQVMKFGGTSVGDAACIARAAQIVIEAARQNAVVAVVSAMSGVTNRLVEAAKRAGTGDNEAGSALIEGLRRQHHEALATLVSSEGLRTGVA